MKNLKTIFILTILVFTYACSPSDEEIDNSPISIYDRIEASPSYSILNYALQKTGLSTILDGDEKYTLFAPSDMVMTRFLNDNGFSIKFCVYSSSNK